MKAGAFEVEPAVFPPDPGPGLLMIEGGLNDPPKPVCTPAGAATPREALPLNIAAALAAGDIGNATFANPGCGNPPEVGWGTQPSTEGCGAALITGGCGAAKLGAGAGAADHENAPPDAAAGWNAAVADTGCGRTPAVGCGTHPATDGCGAALPTCD